MNIQRWIARREPDWRRLEGLLDRVNKKGLRSLQAGEIRDMASLYRSVSADLARARTHQIGKSSIEDLQQLTSRSYSQIYQGSRHQEWREIGRFYRQGLPKTLQQTSLYTAIATLLFLVSALVAWWYAWRDPAFMSLIVPDSLITKVRDEHQLWMGSILGSEPVASSNIMQNNISVALTAIAGGITAGSLTGLLLIHNGLLIGAVGALVGQNQLAYPFWAFVFPHGSLELPAIFLAGGAGFLIARGLLFPGRLSRVDALKHYGRQAARLFFGIVPLLVIAGAIEGFFSPNPAIPAPLKYLTGMILLVLLLIYASQPQSPINSGDKC